MRRRRRGAVRRGSTTARRRRSCPQQQGPEHVERDGRRAVADVGAAAGQAHGPLLRIGVRTHRDADGADRLVRGAAARAGDAGDADPDVRPQPLARARATTPSPPPGRPRRGRRSATTEPPPAKSWPRSSRRRARRARTPTSRRGRSGDPPSARPCRTRRSRSSARRAAGPRPRRSSRRRRRTAPSRAARAAPTRTAAYAEPADGAKTVASSSSPRRRQVVISSGSASASSSRKRRRDLRLGQREEAQDPLLQRPRPREQLPQRRDPHRVAPHRLQLARRPRQDRHQRRRPHEQPRRRPDRLEHRRAHRHHRLLARARPHRLLRPRQARAQPRDDRPDPLLQRGIVLHRSARPRRHDVRGQIVRGRPQTAAGHDQIDARGGSPAPPADPTGRSPTTTICVTTTPAARSCSDSHGPLASGDQPGQHLRAGDDDARAHAHVAQSPTRTRSAEPLRAACRAGTRSRSACRSSAAV